jgi:hypothetical protein
LPQLDEFEVGQGVHAITSLGRSGRSFGGWGGAIYRHGTVVLGGADVVLGEVDVVQADDGADGPGKARNG